MNGAAGEYHAPRRRGLVALHEPVDEREGHQQRGAERRAEGPVADVPFELLPIMLMWSPPRIHGIDAERSHEEDEQHAGRYSQRGERHDHAGEGI